MNLKGAIGLFLTGALAFNTSMSVGLGMNMARSDRESVSEHACCPLKKAPSDKKDEPVRLDCCLSLPAILTGGVGFEAPSDWTFLAAGMELAEPTVVFDGPAGSPRPPPQASSHRAPSSPRAPPLA